MLLRKLKGSDRLRKLLVSKLKDLQLRRQNVWLPSKKLRKNRSESLPRRPQDLRQSRKLRRRQIAWSRSALLPRRQLPASPPKKRRDSKKLELLKKRLKKLSKRVLLPSKRQHALQLRQLLKLR